VNLDQDLKATEESRRKLLQQLGLEVTVYHWGWLWPNALFSSKIQHNNVLTFKSFLLKHFKKLDAKYIK
jgi:hypothetical protein